MFEKNIFMPFVVLGDPDFETSKKIIKKLIENKAGALELGFAFSDPAADGPVIQTSNKRALENGITTEKNFEIIKDIRSYSNIPISLMLSYNLALAGGLENFYKKCSELKINGILFPDVPLEESNEINKLSNKYNVDQIYLIATNTPKERISEISKVAKGYFYLVSMLGTTGVRDEMKFDLKEKINQIKKYTSLPIYIGFGISKPQHITNVLNQGADGAISGSAICQIIENNLDNEEKLLGEISSFSKEMSEEVNAKIKKDKGGDY